MLRCAGPARPTHRMRRCKRIKAGMIDSFARRVCVARIGIALLVGLLVDGEDPACAQPESGTVGVGIEAGTQVSVTGEVWRSASTGYRLAYSRRRDDRTLRIQRVHAWTLFRQEEGGMVGGPQLTVGVGGFTSRRLQQQGRDETAVGLTGHVGILMPFSWIFRYYNVDVVHRFGFSVHALPRVGTRAASRIDAGFGIRYYF
jgi:hypothetical protein